ncbi:MAG: DUF1549 and DUF1553 domain-containing protein [Candidatus Hydrogenedentes bacterium]|nr:DUF1549 and DUF1553 domain-containing protein [Candidatus Hydrogenedentota bacterium]
MRILAVLAIGILASRTALGVDNPIVSPFETDSAVVQATAVDSLVQTALQQHGIEPANVCSDEVFVRRVYLDVIGTLPSQPEILIFLTSPAPDRRAKLIEALLEREEFADYWALKWCDLLRVKAEFPINLWPNAVQAYHRWIRDSIRANKPYDEFARELLTSSGSNFRVPPVNFYRAVQGRTPQGLAAATALTFMGTRLEHWSEKDRADLSVFFSRVAYKKTDEWKEEIVVLDPTATEPLNAVFPGGTTVTIPATEDPRVVFADWLITPENPWFTKAAVNRVWSWLMGRGIIHEPDDIRPDNPPVNLELLSYLEKEFVESKYDLKQLFRVILNSRTYQQSPISRSTSPEAEALFAHYMVRRIDAEVVADALNWICGSGEEYQSLIPEPYTNIPEELRTIALADASITSPMLEVFGRSPRDTGLESERDNQPSDRLCLHMLNSTHIQRKIMTSSRIRQLVATSKGDSREAIRTVYLTVLSRYPTDAEIATVIDYAWDQGGKADQTALDLVWALVNSKEFLYRH